MIELVQINGWFWPAYDRHCRDAIAREMKPAVRWFLEHVPGRDAVIQAGGNTGSYPHLLAQHFPQVFTAEPDGGNYEAMVRNLLRHKVDGQGFITMKPYGLSERDGKGRVVEPEPNNCGALRIGDGDDIKVRTIDGLWSDKGPISAIWLDIEGAELPALKGARAIIERDHPVIACEEKGLGKHFGVGDGEIEAFLAPFGYRYVSSEGRDRLYAV